MVLNQIEKFATIFALAAEKWWEQTPPSQPKGAALPDSFWIKFVQMSQRMGVDPYQLAAVVNSESRFDPTVRYFAAGKNRPPVAQGLSQFIRSTALNMLKMSEDTWRYFAWMPAEQQLGWVEKYFGNRAKGKDAGSLYLMNFGGFPNPDGSLYAGTEAQQRWIAEHPEDKGKFKNPAYQQKAIEQNKPFVTDGRIMPQTVRNKVKGGIRNPGIRKRIAAAIEATQGQPPPAYQEPDPNWSPNKARSEAAGGVSAQPMAQMSGQQPTESGQPADQLMSILWS